MTEDEKPHINAGYPIGQLLKALKSTGAQAQKHIEQWQQVLTGVLDGSLQIGSRTPLKDTPVWVTLEVVHGGFATGSFAASGPLKPHEVEKLKALKKTAETTGNAPITAGAGRGALNLLLHERSRSFRTRGNAGKRAIPRGCSRGRRIAHRQLVDRSQ